MQRSGKTRRSARLDAVGKRGLTVSATNRNKAGTRATRWQDAPFEGGHYEIEDEAHQNKSAKARASKAQVSYVEVKSDSDGDEVKVERPRRRAAQSALRALNTGRKRKPRQITPNNSDNDDDSSENDLSDTGTIVADEGPLADDDIGDNIIVAPRKRHDDIGDNIAVAPRKGQTTSETAVTAYVEREIERLKTALPNHEDLYLARTPGNTSIHTIPRLQSRVVQAYCPTDGRVWTAGLTYWLRSGAALPLIKLWHDACMDDEMFIALKDFLPLKDCPWRAQLAQVTALARLPDAGRSQNVEDIVLVCAIYTRKLFISNHQRLLEDGTNTGDYVWKHIIDIPCAVLFTVYHDLMTAPPGRRTFFSVLLNSPLALPMHDFVRKTVEESYPLPHAYPNPDHETVYFTTSEKLKPRHEIPPPAPADAVDHHVDYRHDPFSEKEQLLFWLAYQDVTDMSSVFGLDAWHIAELLPGRHVQEIQAFYKLNKVNLGLESEKRIVIARSGEATEVAEGGTDTEHACNATAEAEEQEELPRKVAAKATDSSEAFAKLQPYVPPGPLPLQPPEARENLHHRIRAQLYAIDQAQRDRNEAELALAISKADLEDAIAEAEDAGMDSLKVQAAWYERDEAEALLAEKQRGLIKAHRELVLIRAEVARDDEDGVPVCEGDGEADLEARGDRGVELHAEEGTDGGAGVAENTAEEPTGAGDVVSVEESGDE